jgi:cell wall-associated NlpC family hydrolase
VTDREQFVTEARSWIGTPYHLGAMVKGVGCDCGTFLLGVLQACGMAQGMRVERYTHDWFCHAKEERYLRDMLHNASKVVEAISYATLPAEPGNLVLTRSANSRLFNHGGIVVKWPLIIHSVAPRVCYTDATADELWCFREVAVFDPFLKKVAA